MTEAEAISLLLKVAREWLTCNPMRAGQLDAAKVQAAVDKLEAPVPNNKLSGCMVCGYMPCMCPGGRPRFAPSRYV